MSDKIYVAFLNDNKLEHGWTHPDEIKKGYVCIQCEDGFGGARGIGVGRECVVVMKHQKPAPLGVAYYGSYYNEDNEIIGRYEWCPYNGLVMYKRQGDKYVKVHEALDGYTVPVRVLEDIMGSDYEKAIRDSLNEYAYIDVKMKKVQVGMIVEDSMGFTAMVSKIHDKERGVVQIEYEEEDGSKSTRTVTVDKLTFPGESKNAAETSNKK